MENKLGETTNGPVLHCGESFQAVAQAGEPW